MRKSAYEMGISDWGPDLCSSDLLISGLVANLRYNANRKQARVRVFELGRVFLRDAAHQDGPLEVAGVRQPLRLAGPAWGPAVEAQGGVATRPVGFHDVTMAGQAFSGVPAHPLPFGPAPDTPPAPRHQPPNAAQWRDEG